VKVKYGGTGEIPAEIAGTSLLRALGFGADRMYVVPRVRCYGCPRFPFYLTWALDRLVFDHAELVEKGLVLRRGGQVALTDYGYSFTLDVREPNSGPVREIWTVAN